MAAAVANDLVKVDPENSSSGKGWRSHSCSEPSNRLSWRSSPNSCSMRSAVSCRWFRTVSAFTKSPTGNTSLSKSVALANGIKDAHFVSRYSISGLVRPLSQVLIGRNVFGPSVWQLHRFHRGLGTSTRPNTVLAGVLPGSLLVYRPPQCGHARRCSNSSPACWATTKSCTPDKSALPSAKFMPSVSIVSSRRSIVRICRRCCSPSRHRSRRGRPSSWGRGCT